jgi:hypothetical protein
MYNKVVSIRFACTLPRFYCIFSIYFSHLCHLPRSRYKDGLLHEGLLPSPFHIFLFSVAKNIT